MYTVADQQNSITTFLTGAQAARLTPAAAKLTKEGMLSAMMTYAGDGSLTGGLSQGDILSVRDAFRERATAVGVADDVSCCCCCAATSGTSDGPGFSFSSITDVDKAFAKQGVFAVSLDDDGPSCCCCCI